MTSPRSNHLKLDTAYPSVFRGELFATPAPTLRLAVPRAHRRSYSSSTPPTPHAFSGQGTEAPGGLASLCPIPVPDANPGRRRYSSGHELGPFPVGIHPLLSPTLYSSTRSAATLDFPLSPHTYTLSPPSSRQHPGRRLSNEEIIDAMEKEQDAIVLRLTREIMLLKEENKLLRQQQHASMQPPHSHSQSHVPQSRSRSSSILSNVSPVSSRSSTTNDLYASKVRRGSNLEINSVGEANLRLSLLS